MHRFLGLIACHCHFYTFSNLRPLRIMKYVLRICDDHLNKQPEGKIPLIYPILFYGGKRKYTAPLSLWSLFNNSERAKDFLTKPIQLIETNNFRKEDYKGKSVLWTNNVFYGT